MGRVWCDGRDGRDDSGGVFFDRFGFAMVLMIWIDGLVFRSTAWVGKRKGRLEIEKRDIQLEVVEMGSGADIVQREVDGARKGWKRKVLQSPKRECST